MYAFPFLRAVPATSLRVGIPRARIADQVSVAKGNVLSAKLVHDRIDGVRQRRESGVEQRGFDKVAQIAKRLIESRQTDK